MVLAAAATVAEVVVVNDDRLNNNLKVSIGSCSSTSKSDKEKACSCKTVDDSHVQCPG